MVSIRTPMAMMSRAERTRQERTLPTTPNAFLMPPSNFIPIANLTFRLYISNKLFTFEIGNALVLR